MTNKSKKIRLIFIFYWFLLTYIIAALIWWYIALSSQNNQMAEYKIHLLNKTNKEYNLQYESILQEEIRKTKQYIGEGTIFFLLIVAGAVFLYNAIRKQLKISLQQQNFMMAITHELKTPIAIAKLNLETLQKRKLNEIQQETLLTNTLQEANRMNTLCNNLLLSSQIEGDGYRITKENIDLSNLLQHCVTDFKIRYQSKIIQTEIEQDVYVSGDTFMLQIAISNLIENAIKYAPKETAIKATLKVNNNNANLSIIDEGHGIHDSEKKEVFKKFYRLGTDATKKAKGTGLGLFLVDKIVSAHNGKISVINNSPTGSIFVIQLKQLA